MEYPFNDEIFDNAGDEIFQNNSFDSDSLFYDDLINSSDHDNQFFHSDTNFSDVLIDNAIYTHDNNQISFEIEDATNLELNPLLLESENTFKSKQFSNIGKEKYKSSFKPYREIDKSKGLIESFITTSSSKTNSNDVYESTTLKNNFISIKDDSKKLQTDFSVHQKDESISVDGNRKNVLYFNHQKPTIYVTKKNNITSDRRSLSKLKKQENNSAYSIFQINEENNQIDNLKYSLSPSTSSPDSGKEWNPSGNAFQQNFQDDEVLFVRRASAPNSIYEMKYKMDKSNKDLIFSTKMSNPCQLFQNPIPQTGILILTEEEKRTLLLENYSIPTRLPLTKQEERNLKKVRRKIKNKISAQESRRKKKEYMEALEKKVEFYAHENNDLKKRLENQEGLNKSLLGQLRHLQQMLGRASSNTASTCLMVFLLCFSLVLFGMPDRLQIMKPPQSVLVVSNIHKLGYGSIGNLHKAQMTAMQRYLPPDLDGFVENDNSKRSSLVNNNSMLKDINKGNEPVDSLIYNGNNVVGIGTIDQRKGILLENAKDEETDCIQYGPRYFWWYFQPKNSISVGDDRKISTVYIAHGYDFHPLIYYNNLSVAKVFDKNHQFNKTTIGNTYFPYIEKFPTNKTDQKIRLSFFSISI